MPKTDFIIDPSLLNVDQPIADLEAIRKLNPQRHEMEQLSGILFEDVETSRCAGYKEVTGDEFWCRGHMPGLPIMPGVIQLEAVAQLSTYYTQKHDLLGSEMVGFGGVDGTRFRDVVVPGDQLILMIRMIRARRGRMIVAEFQGIVRNRLVVDGTIRGIPLPVEALAQRAAERAAEGSTHNVG